MPKLAPYSIENPGLLDSKVKLNCPKAMPNAGSFLWNPQMMIQMNCRGYAVSQFMQPEPAKYSFAPNIEAKTFIQPEHSYFSHHPGRFFYIKDNDSGKMFSAPYEPMRKTLDRFSFEAGSHEISWEVEALGIEVCISLTLTLGRPMEVWSVSVKNLSEQTRSISVYPYFTIGYMSWMNQSAHFNNGLNAIIAESITPYQKVAEYFKNQHLKQSTFMLAQHAPTSWCANQKVFEGEGGLHQPDGVMGHELGNQDARYETPVAVMHYQLKLEAGKVFDNTLLFGPAKDEQEVAEIKEKYFSQDLVLDEAKKDYADYVAQSKGALTIKTADPAFDDFVNHWLPRQIFYHGDVNRLSTDPQTRNYIQDNLGMCYIQPKSARKAFITALSQQKINGSMPDGILLHPDAELKYINQVPHTDHCAWLAICLKAYLDETGDIGILDEHVEFADSSNTEPVSRHIELSLEWLLNATDDRGLSYIEQGDWCDPMNMVGYKGKGVSAWLSLATAYAINCWCDIALDYCHDYNETKLSEFRFASSAINSAVNKHLWDGKWYGRGITDDGVKFGIENDVEGRIFLNPQSWALLSGAANQSQKYSLLNEVHRQLNTPFGMMMLAPSYTKMREDVGRVTQKHPGTAENGSVYNHAAIFYVFSLYQVGEANQAFDVLKKMIPSQKDALKKGQLPLYVPNYYRGAYYQYPEQAGRSSHLFNTGTVAWVYRCLVEELCGLKGRSGNLIVEPKLPDSLSQVNGERVFQGATFKFDIAKDDVMDPVITVNGERIEGNTVKDISFGAEYQLVVRVPR